MSAMKSYTIQEWSIIMIIIYCTLSGKASCRDCDTWPDLSILIVNYEIILAHTLSSSQLFCFVLFLFLLE